MSNDIYQCCHNKSVDDIYLCNMHNLIVIRFENYIYMYMYVHNLYIDIYIGIYCWVSKEEYRKNYSSVLS